MPHAVSTVDQLQQLGLKTGLITNAQFYTPLLFDALIGRSIHDLGFDPDLCAYSFIELKAKPGTALFQKVVNGLNDANIQPHEALYVGNDMLNDIKPAAKVGFKTVLFAGDQRSLRLRPDHQITAPDAIITSLEQILDLID